MKVLVVCGLLDAAVRRRLLPLCTLPCVESVLVVRSRPGPPLPGVRYRCPPSWLRPRWCAVVVEALLSVAAAWRMRPDLVHGIYLVPHGLTALLAAWIGRSPCVVAIIGTDLHGHLERGTRWWRRLLLTCLRRADRVTATGPCSADRLAELGVDRRKLVVLPHGIDTDKFAVRKTGCTPSRDIDLLFVGRLAPGKRPLLFADLVRRIRDRGLRPIRAVMLGDGPERLRVSERIRQLGLEETVEMAGHVSNVPDWLARSRLLILPTIAEGLPYAVIEAMASEVVPVVSAVGDLPALLAEGDRGVLVDDFEDGERVADMVASLLDDEPRRARIAARARRRVQQGFSLDSSRQCWSDLLSTVSTKGAG